MSNGKDLLGLKKIAPLFKKSPQTKSIQSEAHTWEDYKNWFNRMMKQGKYFVYRGHEDDSWELKTTFHREADRTGMTLNRYLNEIIPEMSYHVSSRLNEIPKLDNKFEFASFLALLQHHGFPTPLLDWTVSPYVGAYFAFRKCNNIIPVSRRVRICVFDFELWRKTYIQPDDLTYAGPYVACLRPFARHNPRQIPQNCVYTVTNISNMQEHIIRHKKTEPFLYYFNLSADTKSEVMKELDLMGINEMTLFPDLDGLCKTMEERFFG